MGERLYKNPCSVSAVQRGGNWNNGRNAGVFGVNLNNAPSHTNSNIGFRCPPEHQKPLFTGFFGG